MFLHFLNKFNFNKITLKVILTAKILIFALFAFSNLSAFQNPILLPKKTSSIKDTLQKIADTIPPIVFRETFESDGTETGRVIDMPDDASIRSNLGNIYPTVGDNYKFDSDTIELGVDREAKWQIKVLDKFKDAAGTVVFKDWAGNGKMETFRYNAPKLKLIPSSFEFPSVITGEEPFTEYMIVNQSDEHSFVLHQLSLKDGNQGFRIEFINAPGYLGSPTKIFGPKDSLRFRVHFFGSKEGKFKDSIGIGTSATFAYTAEVSAKVESPVIEAEDVNFYDITIGDTISKSFMIKNTGKVELRIKYYSVTSFPFWTDLPQITEDEPYIIQPNSRKQFNIYFTPTSLQSYQDSIVFSSNATGIDSVVYIYGHGVKPGLSVTSFNWGRQRIDRPDRIDIPSVPPYTSPNAVWLLNTSQDSIEIYDIEKVDISRAGAFEFSKGAFKNLKLAPGQSKFIEIAFHPIDVGYHELDINYITSIGSDAKSEFKGIGILPRISTRNEDFDTSLVNDKLSPVSRKIVFKNDDWEYADLLYIDSLQILPNGDEISIDLLNDSKPFGTEGFKIYNYNKEGPPWILNIGDSLGLEVNFVAQREGPASAAIRAKSDAFSDTTAYLTGLGIFRGIKTSAEKAAACVYDSDTLIYRIENYGWDAIRVDSLRIQGSNAYQFVEPEIINGFDILGQEKRRYDLVYSPVIPEISKAEILAYHIIADTLKVEKTNLESESFSTTRDISTHTFNEDTLLNLGEELKISVLLDQGDDITLYKIDKILVKIEFDNNFLRIGKDDIKIGDLLKQGFKAPEKDSIKIENGVVEFPLVSFSNGYLGNSGELLKLNFRTMPPTHPDSIYCSEIITSVAPVGKHCVNFINSNTFTVCLNQELGEYLEFKDFSGTANELLDVYPNPSDGSDAFVDFEIKKEGFYEIYIYDLRSDIINTIVAKTLLPGNYKAIIPTGLMSSGVYFVQLKSNDFIINKPFVILR